MHHFVIVTSTTDKVKCFHQTQLPIKKFGKEVKILARFAVKYSCACWNFFCVFYVVVLVRRGHGGAKVLAEEKLFLPLE
eukprot:UN24023